MSHALITLLLGMTTPQALSDDPAIELRVMTFNIRYGTANDGPDHWDHRAELAFEVLKADDYDIVGLQEALKFQIDEILEAVPVFQSVGVGRDDGKEAGEYSNILYRADRFEVLDSGTFWLSDTPEVPASRSWGNRIPRICTWARLKEHESDTVLDVYNTHLDHQSAPSRLRSVELIWQHIQQRESPAPFLFMGDFNAGESSPPLQFLRGETEGPTGVAPPDPGLVDTFRVVHPHADDVGTFHGFRDQPGKEKIDSVLISEGQFEVLDAEIIRWQRDGRYPSDHFPVSAHVRLR